MGRAPNLSVGGSAPGRARGPLRGRNTRLSRHRNPRGRPGGRDFRPANDSQGVTGAKAGVVRRLSNTVESLFAPALTSYTGEDESSAEMGHNADANISL